MVLTICAVYTGSQPIYYIYTNFYFYTIEIPWRGIVPDSCLAQLQIFPTQIPWRGIVPDSCLALPLSNQITIFLRLNSQFCHWFCFFFLSAKLQFCPRFKFPSFFLIIITSSIVFFTKLW
ncbi:hypothetical protein Hanom_Chr06g00479251 [Helianthus anomalus]